MKIEIHKQTYLPKPNNERYCLIGIIEIGNTGHQERKILVSNISYKKAEELKEKHDNQ